MIDEIKSFVEAHPYWIGGGVFAILILYLVSSSSASSTAATTSTVDATTGTDDAVSVAQLQASSAAASTQAQAQLANNQLNAQLQSQQYTDATQITLAEISAGYPITGGSVAPGTPVATQNQPGAGSQNSPPVNSGCTGTIADYSNPNCNAAGSGSPPQTGVPPPSNNILYGPGSPNLPAQGAQTGAAPNAGTGLTLAQALFGAGVQAPIVASYQGVTINTLANNYV